MVTESAFSSLEIDNADDEELQALTSSIVGNDNDNGNDNGNDNANDVQRDDYQQNRQLSNPWKWISLILAFFVMILLFRGGTKISSLEMSKAVKTNDDSARVDDNNSLDNVNNLHTTSPVLTEKELLLATTTPSMVPIAPTVEPVAIIPLPDKDEGDTITPDHYVVHVIDDNDLHYRRSCAVVGGASSHYCLTIRYPFQVSEENPAQAFENHLDLPLEILDGDKLEKCRMQRINDQQSGPKPMISSVKDCINYHFEQADDQDKAIACWSREQDSVWDFYGVNTSWQRERAQTFFNRQVIFMLGMSPTPPIARFLTDLFSDHHCIRAETVLPRNVIGRGKSICIPNDSPVPKNWSELDNLERWTVIFFTPVFSKGNPEIDHPVLPRLQEFRELVGETPSPLKVTVFSEHPIAHLQTQNHLLDDYNDTVATLEHFCNHFMAECRNRSALEAYNIKVVNVLAFDGSPQFFPTQTGAYVEDLARFHSEEQFHATGGYDGWDPKYGSKCYGFLRPTTELSQFNELGRSFYEQAGLDMRWYGRVWEFINLVWYNMKGWNGKGGTLDCTHGNGLVSEMHKYFVMAMIDEHYDHEILMTSAPTATSITSITPPAMPISIESKHPTATPTVAPTSATVFPTLKHVANSTLPTSDGDTITPDHYVVHVVDKNDLRYRRACAVVGESSNYCLTIRYPFEVSEEDPAKDFYDHFDLPLEILDGQKLDECRNRRKEEQKSGTRSMVTSVKNCIEHHYEEYTVGGETAMACWSREQDGVWDFYGVNTEWQRQRMHKFFNRQVILMLGMSPMPPIARDLTKLFDHCTQAETILPRDKIGRLKSICVPKGKPLPTNWSDLNNLEDWTMIFFYSVFTKGDPEIDHPVLPKLKDFRELVGEMPSPLQFTVVSEHPIAHLQTQTRLSSNYNETVSRLKYFCSQFMTECHNQTAMEAQDSKVINVLAFDGSPQFFPTDTGAYPEDLKRFHSEEEFLANGGYESWDPNYGSKCNGFLQPTTGLSRFNDLGRLSYEQAGLDMRWYGRVWEFINLVWYNMKGWAGKDGVLDCTHGNGLVSEMHKYFVMAMVDEHYRR